MRQFEATITLAASPAAVWQHMSDVVRWPDWMETFQRIEPLDAAALSLARRFKVQQPRLREATWVVTRLEPASGFTWESRMPGLQMMADHWIEARGTEAWVRLRFGFGGLFGPLLAALYGGLVQNYLRLECAAYQRRLELA
jgi:uncharacterized membrane protein